jgi:O-antigen/teichoic acid export membrane protein
MANVVSTLSLFVVSVAVGRLAGAANLGRYGLLVVLGAFFGGVIDFGTDRVLGERLAQRSLNWTAAWWGVVIVKGCALGLGLVIGVLALELDHAAFGVLVAIQAASLTTTLTAQAIAAGLQRLRALAIVRVGSRTTALAGIGAVVAFHADLGSIVVYSIVLVAITDILGVLVLARYVFWPELRKLDSDPWNEASVRAAVRAGLPLGISALAVWLYTKLDTVILAGVTDFATLGVYTAAVRLAELLGGIPTALNSITLATLADLWSKDSRRFRLARDAVLAATTIGMGLACLIMFLLAGPIISATYHLPDVAVYLRPLVWGQLFAASAVICGLSLQVSNRSPAVAHIALALALISIPTYSVLIALFGPLGAAVGTTALYASIIPIGILLPASRDTFVPLLFDAVIVGVGLLAAFVALLIASGRGPVPLIVQVPVASLTYVAVTASCVVVSTARKYRIGLIK